MSVADGSAHSLPEVIEETCALLGLDPEPIRRRAQRRSEGEVCDELWAKVTVEIDKESSSELVDTRRITRLTGMLEAIRGAETGLLRKRGNERVAALGELGSAMVRIGSARTVDSVLELAPELICSLGFDRALSSTVSEAWQLHSMEVVADQSWADEILAVGRAEMPRLDHALVENDAISGGRAKLVQAVQENPRVNRALAEVTRSDSYGIAPLVVGDQVVGMIHGDYYHQGRLLNEMDRALLAVLAESLSHNLARVHMLEKVDKLRADLDTVESWPTPGQVRQSVTVEPSSPLASQLTRRESEVMELMAHGDSNSLIARKLGVSIGTVKTHITKILRSLGAGNRAEAVAIWLQGTDRRG